MSGKHLLWANLFRRLGRMGMSGEMTGIASHILSIGLILGVVWGVDHFYLQILRSIQNDEGSAASVSQDKLPSEADGSIPDLPAIALLSDAEFTIRRASLVHTSFPTRPRRTITSYTVEEGDQLFSIAEKFSLNPSSILWANNATLRDDPHNLRAGQDLVILPGNGAFYEWHAGDSLASVAEFYGILPADIINSPANRQHNAPLVESELESGAGLYIPGGKRDFVTWQIPRITRQDADVAQVLGKGTCAALDGGPIGEGSFIWPTDDHQISGYPYAPQANHYGIDLYGNQGDPVYATDAGVSVYSGWNDWGLGNIIVLDHGNGWQSLYAQLGTLKMGCGQMIEQGDVIAEMGISGNSEDVQLHFELMNDEFGRVNPINLLP